MLKKNAALLTVRRQIKQALYLRIHFVLLKVKGLFLLVCLEGRRVAKRSLVFSVTKAQDRIEYEPQEK